MNKEQFLNEVRNEVGVPTVRMKASHRRRMGRKGIAILGAIIVSAVVVSAGLLTMFGALKQDITTNASITLDGIGTGELQTQIPITDAFGGDLIRSEHVLESHSDQYISVDMNQAILEGDPGTPITDNEITSGLYAETGAQGTMTFGGGGSGYDTLTRQANTVDYQWQLATNGGQSYGFTLVLVNDGENWEKIVVTCSGGSIDSAHWYDWTITGWSNSHTLTVGTRDTTSGILVTSPDDTHKVVSILYGNVPDVFSWGWTSSNNAGHTLTVPSAWTGDGDVTNVQLDGVSFTLISFPYLMAPHEVLNFVWRIQLDPLISPDTYSVQVDFIPEV